MSNKPKHSKTNITKISAKSTDNKSTKAKTEAQANNTPANTKTPTVAQPTKAKADKKAGNLKKTNKNRDTEKPLKEIFILARPFVAIGRYLRDSWREIRQVRWPGRKLTWKMTFAVLVYCAIFIVFIVLLDTFFTFIFNLLLNAK